ncbi:DUF2125 domain-containing protein [Gluconobacter kanchanaburiensis]|uniref:DUF2125 domain-containing protein n=1 Tax=Gluconobacter kanchanaburiensis NBRC 103587 TaxID=1307948 RepID=A0A511B6M5_9PROT|nr:DUF2125 domain-containing protein [Gluconobacter kanchanaburiensis]MBF0861176.1 DUF2125 domain-containing protein [Gluconobacter kanchanaburiensis]GBR70816.1 hypothetical protein AA103587_2060 [Gluconobacter kanchanaburiensis NBRC 103587]GEK96004.1 hypothetical protein GKA01_12010 [Gluconobacter kanchanaburiensis NBRC 103587]
MTNPFKLFALTAILLTPGVACASTLPGVPASCFSYELGGTRQSPHALTATSLHATLTGTDITLDIKGITVADPSGHVETATLERFNAVAAYAALSAFRGGISGACQGQSLGIKSDDIRPGTPQATWSNVSLNRPGHGMTIHKASIQAVQTTPDLRLKVEGMGIHDTKQPLMPTQLSADLTVQGLDTARQQITINALHAVSGSSAIDGKGTIEPGATASTSAADLHVSVTNVETLIGEIRDTAPKKVVAALTIARLMGRQSGDATLWDIGLSGGVVTVNRIPLPFSVP